MLNAKQLSEHLNGHLLGKNNNITHWRDIISSKIGGVAIIKSPRDLSLLPNTTAETIIGPPSLVEYSHFLETHPTLKSFLIVDVLPINLLNTLLRYYKVNKYHLDIQINTSQDPNVYIGHDVTIGQNCFFMPGVKIMNGVKIGDNVAIHANTIIKEGTVIGNNVTIDSNCSIGNYAFEYFWLDDHYERIESLGIVVIEDDVEIGSNNTIDRGTFGETIIGKGSKLDNQIQIGHDVKIGKHCLIVSQVGIAGFATIEDKVILHGQVGVAGHVTVGKGTLVKAQAGITKNFYANSKLAGYRAVDVRKFWKKQIFLENQIK